MPLAITHVITSLSTGGAEMMLLKLLCGMDRTRFRNSVIGLTGEGAVAGRIRAAGIPVRALDLRPGRVMPGLWALAGELRRQSPKLIQTWMYHADLIGGLLSPAFRGVPVVWNIRCGRLDRSIDKRLTRWVSRACAVASRRLPAGIVCCSQASVDAHSAAGYAASRMRVIPNGFDTSAFLPAPEWRGSVRHELRIGPGALLVGLVARFNPAKDHANFVRAARTISLANPSVHFLLCGEGITAENRELQESIHTAGIASRTHLLGRREDVPRLLAALDVAVSSSVVEGFPNAVGEAMACAVPCVVTDAGDSRIIVGDTGFVVPTRDPEALAARVLDLCDVGSDRRSALGTLARLRIQQRFGLAAVVTQYENYYEELNARCAA